MAKSKSAAPAKAPKASKPEDIAVLHQLVTAARARLPRELWDYIVGGGETETTLMRNRQALDAIVLRPRVLRDAEHISARTSLFGADMRLPVILAPIGSLQMLHPDGALVASRAAGRFGVMHMLSSATEPDLDAVARAGDHPKLFQLYVRGDEPWVDDMVRRAVDGGYKAMAVTVDLAYYGRRERDLAKGYKPAARGGAPMDIHQTRLTWKGVERIRKVCPIPMMLKGIATAEDARLSLEYGMDAVYVSNHGGRQLDHGKGGIDMLGEVVEAVRRQAPVIVDGGFMRGTDIIKAMALGASAVGIGKLQGLALAAAGEAGVVRMLELLEDEIVRSLGQLGVHDWSELTPAHVEPARPLARYGFDSAFPLLKEGY